MEIRVLRYFLEIAREGNMSRAAERLHVTQPTLSKQMKDLEQELGKKLFKRGSTSVSLTDEGMLLRKRAEDLLAMADKITNEFQAMDDITGGDIYIGCAESYLVKYLARAVKKLSSIYPNIHYHVTSGDTEQVTERLDRGLLDMAFIVEPPDLSKYNYLEVPEYDTWGVLMRKDNPLAAKEAIAFDDLLDIPIFCSEQSAKMDIPTLNQIRQSPFHGNFAYIRTKLHDFFLCNFANLVINNRFNSIRLRKTPMLQMLYTAFEFIVCFQHDTQIIFNKRLIAVFSLMPASRTCLKGFIICFLCLFNQHFHTDIFSNDVSRLIKKQ